MASKRSKKITESPEILPKNLYGWYSIEDVAREIGNSIHSDLLRGEFVCAAKGDWELQRIIITRRLDNGLFMMGVICKGYTAYFPSLPKEAILDFILSDMKEKKVPIGIINDFEKILTNNY